MKRMLIILAVLLGTAFFVPQSLVFADGTIGSANANSSVIGKNNQSSLNTDTTKQTNSLSTDGSPANQSESTIRDKLGETTGSPDMNWVTSNILANYKMYHEDGSITDFALGASHIVTDLFTAINLNIVYPLFDQSLSTMFDLTNITNGVNNILTDVGQYTKSSWQSKAFKGLLYLAFGVGLVWVFAKTFNHGGGLKSILTVLVIAIIGTAWVGSGSTVLQTINTLTSQAQTQVFTATSNINQTSFSDTGDSFQNALRYVYFEKAVARPFALGNFGQADVASAYQNKDKQGNPYRLIGGNVDDKVIASFASKNHYISKDGGLEWYQSAIAFMSPVMSVAYGVPLLMIGLANLLVQLGAVLLYYLAPFTILISLLPKFANSALKTAMGALGLLFAKVGLLFGIMFVSWVGNVTDVVVPVKGSASAMLNSIVYITLMILLWKNKSWLVQTITGSSVANNAMNKISMTKAGRKALNATGEMKNRANQLYSGARSGFNQGKQWRDNYQTKHNSEFDDNALRAELQAEQQDQRKQNRKEYLAKDMQKHARKIRKQRAERLKKMKQQKHQTNESKHEPDNTARYQRSKKLKANKVTAQEYVAQESRPEKNTAPRTRSRYIVRNTTSAITHQPYLRAKKLKKSSPNDFNQKLQQNIDQHQQRKERLEQELK
ncbi:hypothetical protein QMA60_09395 [Leuconostoc suionicum]|uniref:CD3337/EF1877 family mobilome membrane protein n=1 Tax=Leuconostoc TaxID=1243 RepID=UPI0024ADAF93|nr:hypothetical protein [Leuconostoc suionicum]MDI6498880.1 hypothetical protein [Leuconostoc suionicum]MDI6500882.1 hypothetical protein [Leuconostoc suionicum]MDI6502414.1 hypothetical protein [Leuconostoc suionicum]MDI6665829.1 hypothetical protein [Leuconostoc suionicum]